MPGEGEADGSDEEGIYDGLSPRTDHPAWLLLPKRASALVKQPPPGIAAASKVGGRPHHMMHARVAGTQRPL